MAISSSILFIYYFFKFYGGICILGASLVTQRVKKKICNAGDLGSMIPGNGNTLKYSCQGNSMDRGAWWAIVHGVAKSQTRLRD